MGGWLSLFFLVEIVQRWPRLSVELRAAIVKMVRHIRRSSLVARDSGEEVRKMSKSNK